MRTGQDDAADEEAAALARRNRHEPHDIHLQLQ
jgi:hypothetical protein